MRYTEIVRDHIIHVDGTPVRVGVYDLCYPDDFIPSDVPEIKTSKDRSHVTVSDLIKSDLLALRELQVANDSHEYGLMHVETPQGFFSPHTAIQGTRDGVGYNILQKEMYETGGMLLSKAIPIVVTDDIHTHTLVPDVDSRISNLFSAPDFRYMGHRKIKRFWMIGIDGVARGLINPFERPYRDEFDAAAFAYGNRFHVGYQYENAYRDMMNCVKTCDLLLYQSTDYQNFIRII